MLTMTSKARRLADQVETERTAPLTSKLSKPDSNPMLVPALLADTVRSKAMGVKDRSPEEMDELTREVKRGSKGFDKGGSIMDSIRKYSPNQAADVEESETKTKKYGGAASKDFKEGKYGSAALNTAKGLGSAADTLLVKGPKAAAFAARNRLVDGEKYAKGGSVSSRADGIAQRGKTRGRYL